MAGAGQMPRVSHEATLDCRNGCNGTDDIGDQVSKRPRLEVEADRPDAVVRDDVTNSDVEGDLLTSLPDVEVPASPDVRGPIGWVQRQVMSGVNPRDVLSHLIPTSVYIPPDVDDFTVWKLVIQILSERSPRDKLPHINTLDDVINLLQTRRHIVVVTGAGVSVSCGIPDFRSRNGIYARLSVDFPDLPNPQAMFDINFFRHNPLPFYKFAKEIYPGQFQPSLCHRFIALLESRDQLLRNYTQNIDTLEQAASLTRIVQCHGSFATASCTNCKYQVDCEVIRSDIMSQIVPKCPRCETSDLEKFAVMKPDIVFFGEGLSDVFFDTLKSDEDTIDLLIVIGSSMKVRPVAMIPNIVPAAVPQILINREPLPHLNFDVELLGNCDEIVEHLVTRLGAGWDHLIDKKLSEDDANSGDQQETKTGRQRDDSHSDENGTHDDTEMAGPFGLLLSDAMKRGEPYVSVPPNCYMFKGADIQPSESSGDQSEDEESEDEESEGSGDEVQTENEANCDLQSEDASEPSAIPRSDQSAEPPVKSVNLVALVAETQSDSLSGQSDVALCSDSKSLVEEVASGRSEGKGGE